MNTRRSEWGEDKDFTAEKVRDMDLEKYNKLLTSGRRSTKDPKDAQILDIVGLAQNIADGSNKSSDKSNNSNTLREIHPKSGISHPGC